MTILYIAGVILLLFVAIAIIGYVLSNRQEPTQNTWSFQKMFDYFNDEEE